MTWKTCWSCSWTHWVKHGQNWGTSTHACTHEHLMRLDYQGRPRITFNLLNWILKKTFRQHSVTATDRVNFEIDSLLGPWHCCIVTTALGKWNTRHGYKTICYSTNVNEQSHDLFLQYRLNLLIQFGTTKSLKCSQASQVCPRRSK